MNRVAIYGSFEELPKPYEDIFSDTSSLSGVFLSLPWFRHLAGAVFGKDHCVRIYGVEPDAGAGRPELALPMVFPASQQGLFMPRVLSSVANHYSVLFSPITNGSNNALQSSLDLLAQTIAAERPRWDMVDIRPMPVDTPLFAGMLSAFRRAGMLAETYFCFGNWYLDVNKRSYAEYFDSLSSKLKNTLKRKSRQLEEANRLCIEITCGEAGLEKALAAYEQVYNASWKIPESHPAFVPGLARMCAALGWLRLGVAYVDEQPAAAQFWIVSNGVASIYKLAYDERFSKFSVGSILTARLMQHAIDIDRVRQVDYLSGDDPYKRDWMSDRRERRGIIVFNPRTIHGALAALKHHAGSARRNRSLGSVHTITE